jgi:hypothetical protein
MALTHGGKLFQIVGSYPENDLCANVTFLVKGTYRVGTDAIAARGDLVNVL